MLGNLWEYPGASVPETTTDFSQALQALVAERFELSIEVKTHLGAFKHAYTHFRITLHAFDCLISACEPQPLPPDFAWAPIAIGLPHGESSPPGLAAPSGKQSAILI